MTKQVFWTKAVVEAFIDEGNLNERQISDHLGISQVPSQEAIPL